VDSTRTDGLLLAGCRIPTKGCPALQTSKRSHKHSKQHFHTVFDVQNLSTSLHSCVLYDTTSISNSYHRSRTGGGVCAIPWPSRCPNSASANSFKPLSVESLVARVLYLSNHAGKTHGRHLPLTTAGQIHSDHAFSRLLHKAAPGSFVSLHLGVPNLKPTDPAAVGTSLKEDGQSIMSRSST